MFCPGCGSEQQQSQYCRLCGADLRTVRMALEKPDILTASAISARDEIGRAIAEKIREVKTVKELSKVVEGVLPEITKFLETPEEKRLRRIRTGTITAAFGLGAAIAFTLLSIATGEDGVLFISGLGATVFLIGLGIMLNGWHFTIPPQEDRKQVQRSAMPSALMLPDFLPARTSGSTSPEPSPPGPVTEHTTHQLPPYKSAVK